MTPDNSPPPSNALPPICDVQPTPQAPTAADTQSPANPPKRSNLSKEEQKRVICQMRAAGKTNREIAAELGMHLLAVFAVLQQKKPLHQHKAAQLARLREDEVHFSKRLSEIGRRLDRLRRGGPKKAAKIREEIEHWETALAAVERQLAAIARLLPPEPRPGKAAPAPARRQAGGPAGVPIGPAYFEPGEEPAEEPGK